MSEEGIFYLVLFFNQLADCCVLRLRLQLPQPQLPQQHSYCRRSRCRAAIVDAAAVVVASVAAATVAVVAAATPLLAAAAVSAAAVAATAVVAAVAVSAAAVAAAVACYSCTIKVSEELIFNLFLAINQLNWLIVVFSDCSGSSHNRGFHCVLLLLSLPKSDGAYCDIGCFLFGQVMLGR